MASHKSSTGDTHFSFAKIAAMPAPSPSHSPAASNKSEAQHPNATVYEEIPDSSTSRTDPPNMNTINEQSPPSDPIGDLAISVQGIHISSQNDRQASGSSLDGHENGLLKRENSFEDDRTHLSTSSTKMTNFDSKSLASVTTFAMDEKDSVRPDDSASVQAIDEEESLSGAASGAPNSVTGSEAGGRVFRDHFRDNVALRPRGILPTPVPGFIDTNSQGAAVIPPDSVANNFVVAVNPDVPHNPQSLHSFPLHPDEKLMTAMENPKDRLMVLTIEEKVRAFIKYSSEQSLELPPNNSYGRLLAHRLGDYYHLTHFVDNNVTSVRLHRTPFSRLPTPLSELCPASNEKPCHPVPTKIMRRADGGRPSAEGSVAASSSVPSKAASEADDAGQDGDPTSSTGSMSAKDRMAMTREEREAKYAEVRERIFRDFPDSAKSEAGGEPTTDMSRSSSTTGRKKPQRQRTPHDDGFEARSQFNPYYPGMQYGNNGSPAYNPAAGDASYSHQVPYMVGPGVSPPSGGYMSTGQNNAMYSGQVGMSNAPQFPAAMSPQMGNTAPWQAPSAPQQSPFPGYSSMHQPGMMGPQASTKSSPAMNTFSTPHSPQFQQAPGWNSGPFPGNYQQPPHQRNQPPAPWPNYQAQAMTPNMATYSYAQYPGQHLNSAMHNNGNPAMAGNFPRSHFNPQTRSFVPGSAGTQRHPGKGVQPPMQSYGNRPHAVQPNWPRFPESIPNHTLDHSPNPNANAIRGPGTGSQTSIAKWGTPSHLPPKPPPSEVSSGFEMKHRAASANLPAPAVASNGVPNAVNNGPFVVSGGTITSKMN